MNGLLNEKALFRNIDSLNVIFTIFYLKFKTYFNKVSNIKGSLFKKNIKINLFLIFKIKILKTKKIFRGYLLYYNYLYDELRSIYLFSQSTPGLNCVLGIIIIFFLSVDFFSGGINCDK
jgi:hypothetical protein